MEENHLSAGLSTGLTNTGTEAAKSCNKMSIRVMVQKSNQKIVFAHAEEDFVDFLFSFLTIPLGSVVCLLGENSSLGSIDNLYMFECQQIHEVTGPQGYSILSLLQTVFTRIRYCQSLKTKFPN